MKVVGNRTYAAAAGLVLAAVGGYLSGDLTVLQAVLIVLNGTGLGALRAAKR